MWDRFSNIVANDKIQVQLYNLCQKVCYRLSCFGLVGRLQSDGPVHARIQSCYCTNRKSARDCLFWQLLVNGSRAFGTRGLFKNVWSYLLVAKTLSQRTSKTCITLYITAKTHCIGNNITLLFESPRFHLVSYHDNVYLLILTVLKHFVFEISRNQVDKYGQFCTSPHCLDQ